MIQLTISIELAEKYMDIALDNLTQVMGGKKVFPSPPLNENELAQYIRKGLPVSVIDSIMEAFSLTSEDLVIPLGVSISTIKRRHKQTQLSPSVSDRLFRVASIVSEATETLGSQEKAARWLHKPNRALGGDSPLSRLDTSIGFQQVEEVLLRIEYGIFS